MYIPPQEPKTYLTRTGIITQSGNFWILKSTDGLVRIIDNMTIVDLQRAAGILLTSSSQLLDRDMVLPVGFISPETPPFIPAIDNPKVSEVIELTADTTRMGSLNHSQNPDPGYLRGIKLRTV